MSPEDNVILKVENIYKKYGNEEVLKGVSFSVRQGETKVIIGPSGTGKSTLLRCINGLTRPDKGDVWLDGVRLTDSKVNLDKIRQNIGMVFQNFNLFTHLTALDNVRIGLVKVKKLPKDVATEKAMAMLKRVGLEEKAHLYPAQLSGGQQQRVSIARALAMDPKLILFDEPTSALDPELIGEVLDVMRDLVESGMTMVVVSHEMGFVRSVSDEIIFLEGGVVVEQGPPDVLFNNPKNKRTREFLCKINELYGG
ncbi:MAG TPA: amino acid ABC transporter ATP-binding protein [Candidatus Aerophobetes bacterium]|mgnify:CR=1 FL=1|uniref:Amino acid ABC transporter ATP-binding protein n=1 Tax=Aerophobetes bacterium TaxID=2030807 RepID=A0A7V5LZ81_UNCAE|nr:amino acid ABC transporter ATP-binding protein [Candidatus Aerophobetes bacterium]